MPFSHDFLEFLKQTYGPPVEVINPFGGEELIKFGSGDTLPIGKLEREYKEYKESRKERTIQAPPILDRVLHHCANVAPIDSRPLPFAPHISEKKAELIGAAQNTCSPADSFFRKEIFSEELFRRFEKDFEKFRKENERMNEIKTQKIVDLYYQNKRTAALAARDKAIDEALEADKNVAMLVNHDKALGDMLESFKINDGADCSMFCANRLDTRIKKSVATAATREKIDKLYNSYDETVNSNEKERNEVMVLLGACDTYEQETAVLKSYGIIDENGKLGN